MSSDFNDSDFIQNAFTVKECPEKTYRKKEIEREKKNFHTIYYPRKTSYVGDELERELISSNT